MSTLANRDFVKMNGLGNEIVIVDLRAPSLVAPNLVAPSLVAPSLVAPNPIDAIEARAAARQESYDQLMVLYPALDPIDASIRIYNNDGSEAGACGNGMRCVAALVSEQTGHAELKFETPAGVISCWRGKNGQFTVDMGRPRFGWNEIPLAREFSDTRAIDFKFGPPDAPILQSPAAVSMGNPHAIFWVEDPAAYDLRQIGPLIEHDPLFPERANITLAATPSRDRVVIRTWERGAGLTQACGSAACATAVAAARLGRTGRKVTVTLPGGDLAIEWRDSDDHVLMTGPVAYEHKGRFDAALFAGAGAGAA
jgi:diaminopimelate epimerase